MSRAELLYAAVVHAGVARIWAKSGDPLDAEFAQLNAARAELAAWHAIRAGR